MHNFQKVIFIGKWVVRTVVLKPLFSNCSSYPVYDEEKREVTVLPATGSLSCMLSTGRDLGIL